MRRWFPFLGYIDLTDEDVKDIFGEPADPRYKSKGFVFEWFSFGYLFFVKTERKEP